MDIRKHKEYRYLQRSLWSHLSDKIRVQIGRDDSDYIWRGLSMEVDFVYQALVREINYEKT